MPGTDAQRKPVDPGLLARVIRGVRYTLTGKPPDDWFGPSQPIAPVAQQQADGRQFDYPVGFNLRFTPRSEEAISFAQLRALADNCDLVRMAIETRKDQMCRMEWVVRPRDEDKAVDDDPRCKEVMDFFRFPDKEHDWLTWLRMVLEELFVIDAPIIYPRMTRGGDVYSLDLIDGATIKRVISADGRTPLPPDPAYQQIIKGLPAVDYSRDEVLYLPRNPRVNRFYGFSQVEQIITTINIVIRRNMSQLAYYTEGNIPDAIYTVPETWNPDQIKQFQMYWDAMLEGNLEARRHAKFVPGGVKMEETRNPKLKDEYDEWLARVVSYAFSLPPTAFVKQQNRATAETAQNAADEEGIAPTLLWTAGMMNQIIGRWFGYADLEFAWQEEESTDPLIQAQVAQIYVNAKVKTADEVREDLGMEPLTDEQKEELAPPPAPMDANGKPGTPKPGAPQFDGADKVSKKKVFRPSIATARRSLVRAAQLRSY